MSYANVATNYRRNAILNASPEKLIILLYEGALQNLERAKRELETPGQSHSPAVGENLGKAMAIIGELRASLDFEKGEDVAKRLDGLYEFCIDQIYKANVERKSPALKPTIQVMKTLKEAWDEIVPA
jgi:flagellar protein FliS